MKYIALDIETTGLDPEQHDILEVACILDDLSDPTPVVLGPEGSNRCNFRAVLIHEDMTYQTTPFCATMHPHLWSEIEVMGPVLLGEWDNDSKEAEGHNLVLMKEGCMYSATSHTHYCTPENLAFAMKEWIDHLDLKRITVAGKNAASFDLPFLNAEAYRCQDLIRWSHRVLDVGPAFMQQGDKEIPNLAVCMSRAGRTLTAHHSASGDALDVVHLARFLWAPELDSSSN